MMHRNATHNYIDYKYPDNHWALDSTKEGACIAFVRFRDKYDYAIKLNPTDRRGYRGLISYVGGDQIDIQSTFNKDYNLEQQKGLTDITTLMVEIYKKIGLAIVQTAQAGNNSHSFDETTGITQIGSTKEPSMLHTHVWGRGNPKHDYIPGVMLYGPIPGKMFDMMAITPNVAGNEKKVPWDADQLKLALVTFKITLLDYVNSLEFQNEFGKSLHVNIYQPEKIVEKLQSVYSKNNSVDLTFKQSREQHQNANLQLDSNVKMQRTL